MKNIIKFNILVVLLAIGFQMSCGGSTAPTTTDTSDTGAGEVTETEGETETESETESTFTIGGTVSGLTGTLVIQNNDGDDLSLTADGSFTFTTSLNDADSYEATVLSQPTAQLCTINNGSGTVNAANITNITISCSDLSYTVGGTVSGLSGTVTLQNNSGDDLDLSANGNFTFDTELANGSTYSVTVSTQPSTQTCTVSSGTGTIIADDVSNVSVVCSTNTYVVGGTLSGVSGTITLQNNGGDNLNLTSDGSYEFDTEVADGASYAVTISAQPTGQTCIVTNDTGTISGSAVTNVDVSCTSNTITVFSTSAHDGDLGGRFGADTLCSTQATSLALTCGSVHALISVNSTDEIRDMPTNYSVPTDSLIESTDSTKVADDWADLLDGDIDNSLATANVLGSGEFWWNGSSQSGGIQANSCSNWSSDSSGANGDQGFSDVTNNFWIETAGSSACNTTSKVLCLCY